MGEGEEIPFSKYTVKEKEYGKITIDKYGKSVTLEAIQNYGYDVAVQKTDDEFLYDLTALVTDKFYKFLNTGTLKGTPKTFQMALAHAKGAVENKFKTMHRTVTGVVGFVNVMDVYDYLGNANITVQNQFGFQYIKDFMGYNTIFLLSDSEIAKGKVIATPVDNIVMYYVVLRIASLPAQVWSTGPQARQATSSASTLRQTTAPQPPRATPLWA